MGLTRSAGSGVPQPDPTAARADSEMELLEAVRCLHWVSLRGSLTRAGVSAVRALTAGALSATPQWLLGTQPEEGPAIHTCWTLGPAELGPSLHLLTNRMVLGVRTRREHLQGEGEPLGQLFSELGRSEAHRDTRGLRSLDTGLQGSDTGPSALEACPHSVTPGFIQATWNFSVPDAIGPARLRPHTWSPFPGDACGAARLRTHCPQAAGKEHGRGKKHLDRGKERLASRPKEKWPAKGSGGTQHGTPSHGLPS